LSRQRWQTANSGSLKLLLLLLQLKWQRWQTANNGTCLRLLLLLLLLLQLNWQRWQIIGLLRRKCTQLLMTWRKTRWRTRSNHWLLLLMMLGRAHATRKSGRLLLLKPLLTLTLLVLALQLKLLFGRRKWIIDRLVGLCQVGGETPGERRERVAAHGTRRGARLHQNLAASALGGAMRRGAQMTNFAIERVRAGALGARPAVDRSLLDDGRPGFLRPQRFARPALERAGNILDAAARALKLAESEHHRPRNNDADLNILLALVARRIGVGASLAVIPRQRRHQFSATGHIE
jgi:hypothetical protein